jgi:hypothetical protein
MKPIRYVFPGLCSLALANGPMLDAFASGAPDESWQIVPEETLRDLRGGLDLGPLIGNFAIQRVIEVDGQVVARMQIVISNLNRLGQGGMPTISISGPLAELVQVFNPAGVSTSASTPTSSPSTFSVTPTSSVAPASSPATSAAIPAAVSTDTPAPQSTPAGNSPGSAATVATNSGPHIGSTSGNSGTTSATGTKTGSTAQFGTAISQAVAVANGTASANAASPPSAAPSAASQTSATRPAPTTAAASMAAPVSASQASTAPHASAAAAASTAAAPAANLAQSFTQTLPVGNTGNVIVVSNIPNAAAITSEVQNSVQATRVQTLTTITATLNSLQLLSAANIANAVRQQIASGH